MEISEPARVQPFRNVNFHYIISCHKDHFTLFMGRLYQLFTFQRQKTLRLKYVR